MKKHTKQIISGLILFALGGIIIPTIFVALLFLSLFKEKPLAKFIIPGQAIVTIEKQGRYYLWNDYQTIFDDKTYSSSKELPGGLEISLLKNTNSNTIEFVPDQSITSSSGSSHKNSVGHFEIEEPAQYTLVVSGETTPHIFSFGKSFFNAKSIYIALIVFPLEMLMGIGGFILIVIGIINFIKARKHEKLAVGSSPA